MKRFDYGRRSWRRRQNWFVRNLPFIVLIAVLICVLISGYFLYSKKQNFKFASTIEKFFNGTHRFGSKETAEDPDALPSDYVDLTDEEAIALLLQDAELRAKGYDYDGAIELLKSNSKFSSAEEVQNAVTTYENKKATLIEYDISKITHIFFHTLIINTQKAFDNDNRSDGYNQMMVTKEEFEKILQSMYDRGFVLVRLHDLAHEETGEDGKPHFVKGKILLPEGKTPFVMSQDDVCYYEYMTGDGFANRIVIGKDGKPTCEMINDDGSASTGDYDLIPILENFIQKHPDFSYKGARAVIALTGYNGILGYRTAPSYSENPSYEQDKEAAAKVAQCLRDNGWELASHSWGHRSLGDVNMETFKSDTDKWAEEVETLIGPTDIILYPFGSDIASWKPYTDENEKYIYLKEKGFRYFCNVDSNKYWVQVGDDYLRQGRRDVDGYRMYYDIIENDPSKKKLDDLFDEKAVFDKSRPTPVKSMTGETAAETTSTETAFAETTVASE